VCALASPKNQALPQRYCGVCLEGVREIFSRMLSKLKGSKDSLA
jgi:hypothetical protein